MSCSVCKFDPTVEAQYRWELEFRHGYPSLNELGTNKKCLDCFKMNRRYKTHKRQWQSLLKDWKEKIPPATKKRRITITRGWSKGDRAYDYINLVGGAKALIDVFVEYGFLYDDTPDWVEDHYLQHKSLNGKGTIYIVLEEI